jgi:hypothetical protein
MTTGAVSGADPAGPAVPALGAVVEQNRLKFFAGLLVSVLMDAAFLAVWMAAIVAIHAEFDWAKRKVPTATTFMEVVEWILLVITALTLLAWVVFDAIRFFKTLWRSR